MIRSEQLVDFTGRQPMSIDATTAVTIVISGPPTVCRQSISDSWLGNLRECLAHLV
jgi:hypothetical protein